MGRATPRHAAVLALAVAGCGRLGFDPTAPVHDGPPGEGGGDDGAGVSVAPLALPEVTIVDATTDASGRVVAVGSDGRDGATDFVVLRFTAARSTRALAARASRPSTSAPPPITRTRSRSTRRAASSSPARRARRAILI